MARKYSRDNRGRFASSGTGATARGGRLRTASGGKRATQTMTAASSRPTGAITGRAARTAAGQKVMGKLAKRPVTPTQTPGSRIKAPKIGGVSRARLSGQKMNEGAGKRGKARQQRRQTMAIQRQMLGRIKPGKSAEPLSTGGTLAARASLRRARAKAGPGASPAQRGAVKRAGTYLKASKERNRAVVKGATSRGTVAKPKGLKQGAVTAQASPKPRREKKVDYTGAVKLLNKQKAAINRLKNPQQTFNGNAVYARQIDTRIAKSAPMANAQREIRALYGEYRRAQSSAKNKYASQKVRSSDTAKLPTLRKQIKKAAQVARAFKPEYSAETRRRYQDSQARRR